MFTVSEQWKTSYPDAAIGILAMREVINPQQHPGLDAQKAQLEADLRTRYGSMDRTALRSLPTLRAYHTYYKQFNKTFHVQLQLESIVFKGKSIPRVAALVEAMFMAELKNQLLTAGHDLEVVQLPLQVDAAQEGESYLGINGQEQTLKPGDMRIADTQGIISSIVYGPDQRTRITAKTEAAVFTVYAPAGITPQAVESHLHDIKTNILIFAPQAEVSHLAVYD